MFFDDLKIGRITGLPDQLSRNTWLPTPPEFLKSFTQLYLLYPLLGKSIKVVRLLFSPSGRK